jgi:hypothetical protein
MNQYHVTILNYLSGGNHPIEYYTNTIEANSENEAEKIAIKSFRDAMPFQIKGEVVEVYSVNGVVK